MELSGSASKPVESQPQDSATHEFLAEVHTLAGNFSTALKYIETSLHLDPLSPSHYYTKANVYYLQGRIGEALAIIEKGLSVNPSFTIARELRTACQLQLGLPLRDLESAAGYAPPVQELLERLQSLIADHQHLEITEVRRLLESIEQVEQPPLLAWDLYLLVHSGNLPEAIALLQTKVAQKMGAIINFKYDPLLRPLHQSTVYQALVQEYFPDNILLGLGKKPERAKDLLSPTEAQQHAAVLLQKMREEQFYLDTTLSLKELAAKINLHPNKLSWLLNEKVGQNFYNFINSYRLKAFQEKALDPRNQHLNLLGLAYESGFNSKSVFNDYFKKATGLTPKAWIRQHQS